MFTILAALAVALPVACGGSSGDGSSGDEEQIGDAVERFEATLKDGDVAAFCTAIAPSYVQDLGGQRACERDFSKDPLFAPDAPIRDITLDEADIEGDAATALLTNGENLNVVKEDGEWYVEPFAPPGDTNAPAPTVGN